ncbi:MAG: hypothetical protein ACREMX_15965 [Gemmatimonadales bacterium]
MKNTLLMAAMIVLAACGPKKADAPAGETTGEMAPAATPADTAMAHDTAMMGADTTMTRDTAK